MFALVGSAAPFFVAAVLIALVAVRALTRPARGGAPTAGSSAPPTLDSVPQPIATSEPAPPPVSVDDVPSPTRFATPASPLEELAPPPQPSEDPPDLASMRVLVAEDNPVNRLIALKMLANMGIRAEAVENGLQALEVARTRDLDLVLMDCHMPEMDGFEATRAIRAIPGERGRVAIVAVTAKALHGDREACLSSGMDGYLAKPVTRDEMFRALSSIRARSA